MASTSETSDGPVLTVLSKRIRNLRKKLNRITQIEQSQNPIKNKEQQDLLLSKPSLVAVIDELEKLRLPLTTAVDEELKNTQIPKPTKIEKTIDDVSKKVEGDSDDVSNKIIEDLVKVMYFGSVFNVKMRSEFENVMLTRSHERNCCLTYDYVADDEEGVILSEGDLDLLGQMSELLVSRPVDSGFSHEVALSRCVEHARNWVARSGERISGNSSVTYAGLREKLAKVISSDYYKITPEMKAPADVAAEAGGSYVFVEAESEVAQHEQKEGDATDFQRNEAYDGQSSPVDEHPKAEPEAENTLEQTPVQMDPVEVQAGGTDNKEQYVPRRTNQNQRGGGGRNGGGGRGNGRGYGSGRGGRSGGRGGPYQNGRNQYNDQQGNYYPRNQHGGGSRGRGGRGNGGGGYAGGYNNHASGGGAEVAQSS